MGEWAQYLFYIQEPIEISDILIWILFYQKLIPIII